MHQELACMLVAMQNICQPKFDLELLKEEEEGRIS